MNIAQYRPGVSRRWTSWLVVAIAVATLGACGGEQSSGQSLHSRRGGSRGSVVDVATNRKLDTIRTGESPHHVAVSPDGAQLWVTQYGEDSVGVFDTATHRSLGSVELGGPSDDLGFSRDGAALYITMGKNDVLAVVDVRARKVLTKIPVGRAPHGVRVGPEGRFAYVTSTRDNVVTLVDLQTRSATKRVPVGASPYEVAIAPGGRASRRRSNRPDAPARRAEPQPVETRRSRFPLLILIVLLLLIVVPAGYGLVSRLRAPADVPSGLVIVRRNALVLVQNGAERVLSSIEGDGLIGEPSVSPDGKRVAFTYIHGAYGMPNWGGDLYLVEVDSRDTRMLVKHERTGDAVFGSAWSPDGKALLISYRNTLYNGDQYRGFDFELDRVDAATGARTLMVDNATDPAWSPDGQQIAYKTTGRPNIWTARADGGGAQQITKDGDFSDVQAPATHPTAAGSFLPE